jgi:hypothetical protein
MPTTIERTGRNARKGLFIIAAWAAVASIGPRSAAAATPHLRPESADARELLRDASARSSTVRALVDRLERSDVVAYIRFTRFADTTLEGRVSFLARAGGVRYVVIELACARMRTPRMAILAHELQHAVEIADAASIVGTRTLAQHYLRIGVRLTDAFHHETFETRTALDTAAQVRREILATAVRTMEEQ